MPEPLTVATGRLWRLHSELSPDTACAGGYRAVEHDELCTVMECDHCHSRVTTRRQVPGRYQHERGRRSRERGERERDVGPDAIEREAGF